MFTVETQITLEEIDDKVITFTQKDEEKLSVKNHRIYSDFVILEFQGKKITVNAAHLCVAVRNATRR